MSIIKIIIVIPVQWQIKGVRNKKYQKTLIFLNPSIVTVPLWKEILCFEGFYFFQNDFHPSAFQYLHYIIGFLFTNNATLKSRNKINLKHFG